MVFSHLGIEEGLSQGTVTKILQDQRGFIWIATESGLNRYDGSKVQRFVYERGATNALENDFIWDIDEDINGDLWLATDGGGIAFYDQQAATFAHFRHRPDDPTSLSSDAVRSIEIDSAGNGWIGTRDAGLNRLDIETQTLARLSGANLNQSIPADATVFDILEDRNNVMWFATSVGLYSRNSASGVMRRFHRLPDDVNSLSGDTVITVYESSDGTIWAGTYESGLNAIDVTTGTVRRYRENADISNALSDDYVRDILEDTDGRLWVATAGGLSLFNEQSQDFTNYKGDRQDSTGLASNYLMALAQDATGVLWIGTRGAGVSSWNSRSWDLGLTQIPVLSDNMTVAFATDNEDHLWVGTMGAGLHRLNRVTGEIIAAADLYGSEFASLRTMSLLLDSRDHLWVGSMANGLRDIDLGSGAVTTYRNDPLDDQTLSSNGIMSLHEDPSGRVWVGTFGGGLNQMDSVSRKVTRVKGDSTAAAALASSRITAINSDDSGRLWMATDGAGLLSYQSDNNDIRQYVTDDQDAKTLSFDRLYALHYAPDSKRLWIGTAGRGLDYVTLGLDTSEALEFQNVSVSDGLSDNVVYGIESDSDGKLWLSSNNGLMHHDWENGVTRAFHRRHGLQGEEFNFGAHHQAADGTLFFAGAGGFNAFRSERVITDRAESNVVLTMINIDNQAFEQPTSLTSLKTLELRHDQNSVTFEVAVTDFVDTKQNRISYFLEGFDRSWSQPATATRFTYTNLDAGDYTLRIRPITFAGTLGTSMLSLSVSVQPAPWATWWAYLLYGVFIALASWLCIRAYRTKLRRDAKIERLSHSDPLTGLANRSRLLEHLSSAIGAGLSQTDELVVLVVDFNHIKRINDSFGHEAGDQALQALANRILHVLADTSESTRICETARLSGDEFAIVLGGPNASKKAARLGNYIADTFSESTIKGRARITMSTSVGMTVYPQHGDSGQSLLENAQAAAHAAYSDHNGNRFLVFSGDIEGRIKRRLSVEHDLRRAIGNNEFRLYLQPKFDTHQQTLTGAEALIRWQHPERGLVSPAEFIPIAEESGFITELGAWVVQAAANRIKLWQDTDAPVVPIAVNLSGAEFRSSNPAQTIQQAAMRSGIDVRLLQVELTESVIMHDADHTLAALRTLRKIGCELSVDDFGTGYSSLAYLRKFPLDTLKIDRAFINDMTASDEGRSICAAIVAMAHSLNLTVVAEGVETEEQMLCLQQLNCDQVQGFFLGKPVPEENFAALFGARAVVEGNMTPQPFIRSA